jgi:poly(hydroxyalkanoate) granule-associated protein
MAMKKRARARARGTGTGPSGQMIEALHKVWLAGLGAAYKAQRGAPQLFDELIAEGARVHEQTRGAAEKAIRELVGNVQSTINERIGDARGKAADALENLEKIFQIRVHRALNQLGVPSAEEVAALSKRVDALNSNIGKLGRQRRVRRALRAHVVRKAETAAPAP